MFIIYQAPHLDINEARLNNQNQVIHRAIQT